MSGTSAMSYSDELNEPSSPLSASLVSSSASSYSSSSSSSSSFPPSSPRCRRSRALRLPRVHLTRTSHCSIQETRYAEYLQHRSAMKTTSPHLPYASYGLSPVVVKEEGGGSSSSSRRVQRSLMSEFESAEETTEEEETSGEENRSEGGGSDSERDGSSLTAHSPTAALLVSTKPIVKEQRALSAVSSASLAVSAVSNVASSIESLEKELPLLMDTLFADDEESIAARRNRRRIAPSALPPLPVLPASLASPIPSRSVSASAASSPVTRAQLSPLTSSSSPSTPSNSKPSTAHFVFRSPASPTSSTNAVSPYPALVSAARVSITPAPRQQKAVSAAEPQASHGHVKSSSVSSFFSFGKKAATSANLSPTSAPSPAVAGSAISPPITPHSAPVLAALSTDLPAAATSTRREVILRSSYLLTAVDAVANKPGHTFLCLNLAPSPTSSSSGQQGLQLVEDDHVVRHIDLAAVTRCSAGMEDAHVVSVMYVTKRAGGIPDTNDRVEFRLASLLDAQHVQTIVNNVIAPKTAAHPHTTPTAPSSPSSACSTPSSPLSSAPTTPVSAASPMSPSSGQACVHRGWVELQCAADKDNPWQRRYGRLYSNRLVLHRTASSSLPLHVYPLIVDPLSSSRSSVRTNRYQHVIVDLASEQQTDARLVTLRCEGPDEFKRWMDALTAQLSGEGKGEAATKAAPAVVDVKGKKRDASVSSSLSSHSLSSLSNLMGSGTSLAPLLSNQKAFMSYVFELSTLSPFFPSTLPTPAAFVLQTPSTFLRRRHQSLSNVEAELGKYEHLLSSLAYLWNETRLVMVDELEQSGSGQIGFSFPGFDTQLFDVGRLSVVCSGQLLAAPSSTSPHPLTFTQHDYHSAIDSSSPLKEMMTQASPDLTSMLHSNSPSSRHAAKLLSVHSQRLLLHHCTIASYMKAEWSKWRSGDRVSWATMAAGGSAVKRNDRALACYASVQYVWNPSLGALHRCIQAVKAAHRIDAVTQAMSFPPVETLAEPNHPVTAGLPVVPVKEAAASPSAPSSGSSSGTTTPSKLSLFGLSRGKSSSVDTTITSSPTTPLSPPSPNQPSPSAAAAASPTSPSSTPAPEVRCLVDSIHLVFLLRTLLHYRRHALSSLHTSLLPALAAHSREHSVAGVLSSLISAVERERDNVVRVLSVLPSQAEIEREDKRQRRERKERRRDAEKRRAAMEEKQREQSLLQQIVETKQLLHEWELEHADSRSSNVSYFYMDSVTSIAADTTADGLTTEALHKSAAELLETDRELPPLPTLDVAPIAYV